MRSVCSAGSRCATNSARPASPLLESLESRRHLSTTIKVPGTANPWLVTGVTMPNPGTTPPVVKVTGGQVLTFPKVTGTITNGTASNGADGRNEKGTVLALGGLSGIKTGNGFFGLVGVFVTDAKPTANPPASLDYTNTRGYTAFSPKLNQVFFIGDGKTGTGSGTVQKFTAPAGATRLFIGLPDSPSFNGTPGEYGDNGGSLSVTVEVPPPAVVGSIAGQVFKDTDGDAVKDAGETGLAGVVLYNDANNNSAKDATEVSAVTDSSGNYKFAGLAAATYKIRQVLPAGYTQTLPTNGYGIQVVLGGGQAATGRNFGDKPTVVPTTGGIRGTVFGDVDKDGAFDGSEFGLGAWTAFIDADKDGVLDSGEKTATTDADGNFAFTGLTAGTYTVRVVGRQGSTNSTPASLSITLAAGQNVTGALFGVKKIV